MERRVTGEFARILETKRDLFNSKFACARRLNRHLEAKDFLDHLAIAVAPIIENSAKTAGSKIDDIAVELYNLSLELFALGCLGKNPKYHAVEKAWREFFPEISDLVIKAPRLLATSISNALVNISAEKGADENRWLEIMRKIAPVCKDEKIFLKAGIVAAWRCGMAHYRKGALESCENIPMAVLAGIFGLKDNMKDREILSVLQRVQENRWHDPSVKSQKKNPEIKYIKRTGGFRGFGGPFVTPPRVIVADGQFLISDSEYNWIIHTDVFGATLHRSGKGKLEQDSSTSPIFTINKAGKVMKGKTVKRFPKLAYASSWASTEDTMAVCLPFSHYVYLIAYLKGQKVTQ